MIKAAVLLCLSVLAVGCSSPRKQQSTLTQSVLGERAYGAFLKGEHYVALELYRRSYEQARRADLINRAAHDRFNMGRVFYELNELDSAITAFSTAYDVMNRTDLVTEASIAASFVALCYAHRDDFATARRWHTTSASHGQLGDRDFVTGTGARLDWMEKNDVNAITVFQELSSLYKKKRDHSALARMYYYMAEIRFETRDMESVKNLLSESLSSLDMAGQRYWRWNVLLALCVVHLCTGDESAGNYYYYRALKSLPDGTVIPSLEDLSRCRWIQN